MMAGVQLRPANRNDAADLAILDNIAGHGISNWFWQGAVLKGKAEDSYDWGRSRMLNDDAIFGWKNAVIAEENSVTLGSCTNYLMPVDDEEPEEAKDPPQFAPVFELFSEARGDWFIDALAVYHSARGRGVGRLLLDDAFARGHAAGANRVSLVAEDSNTNALRLYAAMGMSERNRRPFIPFNGTSKTQNWLLLSAALSA